MGHYLAGLVEGDGYIFVPTGNKKYSYPYVRITFHEDDLPLINKLRQILGYGNIMEVKGKEAFRFTIYGKNVIPFIELINGKFRTPKIDTLHKLITWYNNRYNYNMPLLPLDTSNLGSNAWLAGFSDADGSFYINYYRAIKSKNPKVSTVYKLSLACTHAQTGGSLKPIMTDIAKFFDVNITSRDNYYRLDVTSRKGFESVINYFSVYPLFSYKYFNYMACVEVHNLLISKQHLTLEGQASILNIKEGLKDRIKTSNWAHLNNFYT